MSSNNRQTLIEMKEVIMNKFLFDYKLYKKIKIILLCQISLIDNGNQTNGS